MPDEIWTMYLIVDHVYDGDTIVGELDQGLNEYKRPIRVRMLGLNAPELKVVVDHHEVLNQPGVAARDYLMTLTGPGDRLRVDSVVWDKYSQRVDGYIYKGNSLLNSMMKEFLA